MVSVWAREKRRKHRVQRRPERNEHIAERQGGDFARKPGPEFQIKKFPRIKTSVRIVCRFEPAQRIHALAELIRKKRCIPDANPVGPSAIPDSIFRQNVRKRRL